MGNLLIGTSGWSYKDWVGPFYPKGMPSARWFSHYCAHFQTVELNVTFYRIPTPQAVENWRETSPRDFKFAIKMNRQVTHIRRLVNAEAALDRFLEMAQGFKSKLSAILLQLPPSLAFDQAVVGDFLAMLRQKDPDRRYALEFRHNSWLNPHALALLYEKNVGVCIPDYGGEFPQYEAFTTPYAYIRFHGPGALYASKYSDEELAAAAAKINAWRADRDVYVYFNNDMHGYGIENAFTLMEKMYPQRVGQAA